jgi:hypothetical protein
VCQGEKKKKEERRDVRSTRYLMDQGNDDVKSKRKDCALLRSSFARPHLPARGGIQQKKRRANQSRMNEKRKRFFLAAFQSVL